MKYLLTLVFLLIYNFGYCQSSVDVLIDSLNRVDQPAKKINLSKQIADLLKDVDWERALVYLELAESEAKRLENPKPYLASVYESIAQLYSAKDVLDVALDYHLKAYNLYRETSNFEEEAKIENNLAIIYARMNNKDKALEHFKRVYKYQTKSHDSLRLAQILNNIGTLYLEKNVDSSLYYYQTSFDIADKLKNSSLYAYVYTNLGRTFALKQDNFQAKIYFAKAVATAEKNIPPYVEAFVYKTLSEYYQTMQASDSAIYYAAKTVALHKENLYSFGNLEALNTLYKAYIDKKDYESATKYFEQFNAVRDTLNVEEKAVNVERLKLQQDYKTRNEIRELKDEKQRFKYLLIGLSLVAGILALLILLIKYRNRIIKNQLEQEILKSKQQELRQSLDAKNNVLIGKAMTEMHRTDIINDILKDLKHVKLKAVKKETQEAIDFILNRLQRDLNTDIWQEFEVSFEQVHKSFYKNLNKNHPDLSPKDRRLCALLFLDMTSKEISQITGQSFKSVENARTRLRKKLDLTNEKINLSTYLNSLSLD